MILLFFFFSGETVKIKGLSRANCQLRTGSFFSWYLSNAVRQPSAEITGFFCPWKGVDRADFFFLFLTTKSKAAFMIVWICLDGRGLDLTERTNGRLTANSYYMAVMCYFHSENKKCLTRDYHYHHPIKF